VTVFDQIRCRGPYSIDGSNNLVLPTVFQSTSTSQVLKQDGAGLDLVQSLVFVWNNSILLAEFFQFKIALGVFSVSVSQIAWFTQLI
jgi:hypothetical protein